MRALALAVAGLGLTLVGASALVAAPAAAPPKTAPAAAPAAAVKPEALQALKKMSAYLATLPAVELTSNTSLDVVTLQGERVQLDAVVNYKVRRPNGFTIKVESDGKKRQFFYDGKKFTVYAPALGYYATADAPPTIRQTLDTLHDKFGIQLPLEDLFRWNDATDNPAENLTSGYYVGTASINGIETDQYAFRQPKVDWQIWISKTGRPLPLKVVIVDKTDPANPAYTARLTWKTTPTISAADFSFRPTKGAKLIRLSGN